MGGRIGNSSRVTHTRCRDHRDIDATHTRCDAQGDVPAVVRYVDASLFAIKGPARRPALSKLPLVRKGVVGGAQSVQEVTIVVEGCGRGAKLSPELGLGHSIEWPADHTVSGRYSCSRIMRK